MFHRKYLTLVLFSLIFLSACSSPSNPQVLSFTAEPTSITAGESTRLNWRLDRHLSAQQVFWGATPLRVTLQPGDLDVTGESSAMVTPTETTTYTLVVEGVSGATAQVTVTVDPATQPDPEPDPEPEPEPQPEPGNEAPVATPQSLSTDEDTPLAITLSGTDADGDTLSYTVTSPPTHGTLSGTAPNLIYTPNAEYSGQDSFSFSVSDGELTSEAAISLEVREVNDAPVIATPPAASASIYLGSSYADSLSLTDVDSSSFSLSVTVEDEAVLDPASFSADCTDGNCSFSLSALSAGTTAVTLTASDDGGASASVTVSVTVLPAVIHSDPVGDFEYQGGTTDVIQIKTFIDNDDFVMEVSYANPDMSATIEYGYMVIDLDRDPATGSHTLGYCGHSGTGYEARFNFYDASFTGPAGSVQGTITREGNTTTARIPTAYMGTDPNVYYRMISGYGGPSDCVTYPAP